MLYSLGFNEEDMIASTHQEKESETGPCTRKPKAESNRPREREREAEEEEEAEAEAEAEAETERERERQRAGHDQCPNPTPGFRD